MSLNRWNTPSMCILICVATISTIGKRTEPSNFYKFFQQSPSICQGMNTMCNAVISKAFQFLQIQVHIPKRMIEFCLNKFFRRNGNFAYLSVRYRNLLKVVLVFRNIFKQNVKCMIGMTFPNIGVTLEVSKIRFQHFGPMCIAPCFVVTIELSQLYRIIVYGYSEMLE